MSVDYAVTGGTALEGTDYELIPGTLTFEPGETVKSLTFIIKNNELVEADKTIQFSLADPVNAYLSTVASHTYTIKDDDPAIDFAAAVSSVIEDGGTAKVTVKLANASTKIVTVNYAATGGIAVQGTDYKLTAGTLTFQPGETSKEIAVEVINDDAVEADETIVLALTNPVKGHLGGNKVHTLTILDDDPAIDFATAVSSVSEDGGTAKVSVKLANASTKIVTVDYAATGGTAVQGTDYKLTAGTLTFQPGETSKEIALEVINDDAVEADEPSCWPSPIRSRGIWGATKFILSLSWTTTRPLTLPPRSPVFLKMAALLR